MGSSSETSSCLFPNPTIKSIESRPESCAICPSGSPIPSKPERFGSNSVSSVAGVTIVGSSSTLPEYLYKNGNKSKATMAAIKNGASLLVLSKRVFLGLPSLPILEEIRLAKDLEAAGLLFLILSLKVKLSLAAALFSFFSSGIRASY